MEFVVFFSSIFSFFLLGQKAGIFNIVDFPEPFSPSRANISLLTAS
jgi:hypothetical protein